MEEFKLLNEIKDLKNLLKKLDGLEPNRFLNELNQSDTPLELFNLTLELRYVSQSKHLRDTINPDVHILLNEISSSCKTIFEFFTVSLLPETAQQSKTWRQQVSLDENGKYIFRDDGTIRVCLLSSELKKRVLNVKRIWNHVCNYDGSKISALIELTEKQEKYIKNKLETLFNYNQAAIRLR